MDIGGTIAAVGAALGVVKELREIDTQIDQAVWKLKVADLTTSLADAKLGLVDVADQLRAKDSQIADLRKELEFRSGKLVDRGEFRYFADANGEPKGYPICPVCERKGDFLVVVQDRTKGAGGIVYSCPKCKANYGPYLPNFKAA